MGYYQLNISFLSCSNIYMKRIFQINLKVDSTKKDIYKGKLEKTKRKTKEHDLQKNIFL